MSNDPMRQADGDKTRQADIQRRLANLAKAPRCGAKTRGGVPCRQAAVRGRGRCRMHGGAKGSGGPAGPRNGNFKTGLWTRENIEDRKRMRERLNEVRALVRSTKRD